MSENYSSHAGRKLRERRSYGKVARASVMWGYLRSGLHILVLIPTTVILARLLTPEEFGIAAAATFFGQLSGRLSGGGLGSALVRVKELRSEHISTIFTVNAAMTALLVVGLLVAAPFIGRFYGNPAVGALLPIVAVTFALGALSHVQQALLNRDLRYREMTTIGSLDTLVTAVAAVVFAALGFRYWSIALGDTCGALVKFIYGVRVVGWHARLRFVPSAARELGSFAAGGFARRLLEHLTRNVDNLVVGRVLGLTALGFYDKAFSVVNRLYLRMMVVGPGVSFRIFSIIQDEPERFRLAYHKVIMTATLLSYTVFAAIGTMAPHLVVVAFGERWAPAVVPLQILCFSFSLKALNQYAVSASQARGWIWPQVWRQVVQVLCIVVGVYLATPWGITGAAFAVLAAAVVMFLLTQSMMRTATGLGWADILRPQMPAVTAAALLVGVLWGIDGILASRALASPLILLAQAAAAAVVMLAFVRWCPFRDARVLMHDAIADMSPRLAAWMWNDVASLRQSGRSGRRRRTSAPQSDVDAGNHVAP